MSPDRSRTQLAGMRMHRRLRALGTAASWLLLLAIAFGIANWGHL